MVTGVFKGFGDQRNAPAGIANIAKIFPTAKVSEPINSRAEDYRSPGDNRSPAGETIPAGTGASSYDGKIIFFAGFEGANSTSGSQSNEWISAINDFLGVSGGGAHTTFVMLFADCIFTSSFSLLKLYADEQLIVSNVAPTRQSSQTIDFCDGTQTTPHPILVAALGADKASALTGFCYAVFVNFDCAPFGYRVPLIRAVLSGAVTDVAASEEQSTLTFGSFGVGYANGAFTVDPTRNWHYQIVSNGDNDAYVVTIDIGTNTEINRARIYGIADFETVDFTVALPGTDFIACSIKHEPNAHPALLNVMTGQLVAELAIVGSYQLAPSRATLLSNAGATRFLVVTDNRNDATPAGTVASDLGVFLADVTSQTLTYIVHPSSAPAAGVDDTDPISIAFGPVIDGVATIWWTEDHATAFDAVYVARVNTTSFTSGVLYAEATAGKKPKGVAYDSTRNLLVVYRADGSFLKLNVSTGAVLSTTSGAITDFNINIGVDDVSGATEYRALYEVSRPGYVIATRGAQNGDIYEINLDTFASTLLIDRSAFSNDDPAAVYFDQIDGVMTEGSDTAGIINKISLGGKTPNATDLEDIFTQLATFDARFGALDLTLTDFPGGETKGFKVENDTTIDNLENSIAELFDVKIVESDGKRKYFYPKRDGSFAVDVTLGAADFVERGPTTIEKTFGAGEDEFAGCTVQYFDIDADYKKLDQTYRRPVGVYDVTRSKKLRTINTVLSLTASQAVELATLAVFRSVLGNETYSFGLVPGMSHVEPADILQFDFSGFTVYGRVKEATLAADYSQECLVYQYLQFAQATFTGGSIDGPVAVPQSVNTRLIYLDVPLLSYAHDKGGAELVQYVQMAGFGTGQVSAAAYKSTDGTTYTSIGTRFGVVPIVGVVSAVTGYPADPSVTDGTNTITVFVSAGDAADIVAGARAAIGQPGRWCVITFDDVSVSGAEVTLSDLTWGYDNGSEVWRDQVTAGDLFVLINSSHYMRFGNATTLLDDTVYYKGGSTQVPLWAVQTYAYAAAGVAETPYAPTNLSADVSGSDIALTWDYRSRLATGINPATHGESTLSFEIDIMDGATVKRTLTATTNSKTYAAADIATDFGGIPTELTFRVYMMSALVGRGYRGEATIALNAFALETGDALLLETGDELRLE